MTDETQQMPPPLERATSYIDRMNWALSGIDEAIAELASPGAEIIEVEGAIKRAEMYQALANTYANAARAEVALFATISANSEREVYIEELEAHHDIAWRTLGEIAGVLLVPLVADPRAQCDAIVQAVRETMGEVVP